MNIRNNLFFYGTSELSQDAFICYLLSFAMEEYKSNDKELSKCAKELLINMGIDDEIFHIELKRQYKKIDILVEVNKKYNIIIEDKTFTSQSNGQINKYKRILEEEGRENIMCVYYKIIEQAKPEEGVINITRKELLNIFRKYKTNDKIFNNYVEYLEWIDKDVNSYKNLEIGNWSANSYRGFFTHLIEDNIIDKSRGYGWDYVANNSGGFMGLWWHWVNKISSNTIIDSKYFEEIYLQIENDIIAIKLSRNENCSDIETAEYRWKLYEYFKSKIPEFNKKIFRNGKYMTIGFINYNNENYKEKIKLLERTIINLENETI